VEHIYFRNIASCLCRVINEHCTPIHKHFCRQMRSPLYVSDSKYHRQMDTHVHTHTHNYWDSWMTCEILNKGKPTTRRLLSCNTLRFGDSSALRRNILPSSSGSKSRSRQPAEEGRKLVSVSCYAYPSISHHRIYPVGSLELCGVANRPGNMRVACAAVTPASLWCELSG
jgi:hypothetical protein